MAWLDRLKRAHRSLVAGAQRVLLPVCLWFAYFLGLGLTWLAVRLFKPGLLKPVDRRAESFWQDAQGYEPDEQDCLTQS